MPAPMESLVLKKTEKGLEALRTRDPALPKRLRAAFILFDGHKSVAQVMPLLPAALALEWGDISSMLQAGWLELLHPTMAPQVPAPSVPSAETLQAMQHRAVASAQTASIASPAERYQKAYTLTTALLGEMGLRGFRLQLAVEKANGYDDLVALLPRLQASLDPQKMRIIENILLQPDPAPPADAGSMASNGTMPVLIP